MRKRHLVKLFETVRLQRLRTSEAKSVSALWITSTTFLVGRLKGRYVLKEWELVERISVYQQCLHSMGADSHSPWARVDCAVLLTLRSLTHP